MSNITLYGSSLSLYTGRARSYLIKAGLDYREVTPVTPNYRDNIVARAGGRRGVPTIETADGEVIRDGVAIVDYFEQNSGHLYSPKTPRQKILSLLFDVIGAEGLLRPAMHYRWNFPEHNLEFLAFHFQSMVPRGPNRIEQAEKGANAMRAACAAFGAVPDTFELVETLYLELLKKLNHHFSDYPYLLGGKPCVGDFGMIAPFFGHLGRDPMPLSIMQTRAVRLFRWVERMNRPEPDVGEFETQDGQYLPSDEIPGSLIDVLKHLAIDFIPETIAASDCINDWIDQQKDLAPGTEVMRGVGIGSFEARGVRVNALAQPFRFYLLKRLQDYYTQLDKKAQVSVSDMLASCDMLDVLDIKLSRGIERHNNLEVWR
ncbi:MAG: glutathione S-transferase [Gammaproteobacteria bacterium]|jgi:glutathione S-transferase|nr:glutathione S-transferase [Gammaproteobacteria bacterium]MBT5202562.1 glutathione S-transferase [Gammaproteobacteria bacterium]MBT5603546.1 glutathione S-transferase [Gammaproteobacteria bacterium]MBT6244453.1 glutathione S-transferase [Gammaproteobacteria bacterium]